MGNLARAICAATILASSVSAVAQGTTTAFDGTYAGMSRTLESTMSAQTTRSFPPSGWAAQLTIVNGIARTAWLGTAEGSVSPQGVLVMRAPNGARFEGQIDGQGIVKGRFTSACSYEMVWQKKGK
jgi:hypothetical protein